MKFVRHGLVIFAVFYITLALIVACANTHSVTFIDEACIKPFKRYDYHTCKPLHVNIDGAIYVIPQDFKTDLASIPRPLWSFIAPQYSGFVAPAILHDYLYRCSNHDNRKFADEVLYSSLVTGGVKKFTAVKFYVAVRLFGWTHYGLHHEACMEGI